MSNESFNRIVRQGENEQISISLIDIDTIISNYMESNIIPELEQNGAKVKVPLVYGNSERWKSSQRDGYLKDKEGRIQLPIIMFKRNSITKNDDIRFLKDASVTYPTILKYSKKNAYDRFSILNPGFEKRRETFDVRMPDYVNVSYEVTIWTSYTEHMNKIQEAFSYAGEQYWGDKDKYRFRVVINEFTNTQEIGAGTERIIRCTFTMMVYAYILPKTNPTDGSSTSIKGFTIRKVVVTSETVVNIPNAGALAAYTEKAPYDQNNTPK